MTFHHPQRFGRKAETKVATLLGKMGCSVKACSYDHPFDLMVNGRRVEVKAAMPSLREGKYQYTVWHFNLHRHGVLSESLVDFYVLRLDGVPDFKAAIHLVIPAPVKRKTISITLRSLIMKYAQHVNRFDLLGA